MTKIDLYSDEKYSFIAAAYQLADTRHTGGAGNVIARCAVDSEKFPVVILDDEGNLVGFFCLHIGKGPEQYGFSGEDVILLRAFSIDDRFRRQGYASSALTGLPALIHEQISSQIHQIVLAVNAENIVAQKTYEKAGFDRLPQVFEGTLGPLLIMEKAI
ncbi:GNAT family N-acetyltransferase [Lactococcus allomyrinae]|uniref:GNAT family N-acetyltransferase n=1 Tax=Lactococcus allomyrinae TaxID=2419773 RepID=A0A387B9Q3_9LACT|nr:GNAT family N-acetyltransferase [Lactococcus allomyrinae]AYG00565.1 GNAT family N-acetyltransferase [Lactococcus allomyrinae]